MHQAPSRVRGRPLLLALVLVLAVSAVLAAVASARTSKQTATIKVGLITKDVTNPFFVKMKLGARAQAKKLGSPSPTFVS